MLQSFLSNLRKQRSVGASKALQSLSQGWTAESNGVLKREFQFSNFEEASNFIYRYTQYCHKTNFTPSWSNVYNKVNVTLKNQEFGEISTKEVELAQYLDKVSKVQIHPRDSVEALTYEQVIQISGVDQSIDNVRNKQNMPTPLFGDAETTMRLTAQ
eukprot:403366534